MFNNMLMGAAGQSIKSTGGFQVNNSVVLNEPDDEYFTRTPSSASNQKTWTFSTWIKRGELGADRRIFTATNNGCELFFDANDKLNSYQYTSGSYVWNYISTQLFRDPHAWYHIVVRIDTTQATASNRVRLYVNGEQIEDFDTSTAPSVNATGYVNSAVAHYIGRYSGSDSMHYDGYLAETVLIDGRSLGPTSFGETDDNGVWRPIDLDGSGLFTVSSTAEAIANSASATNSSGLTTYTYSGVALGTASSTRAVYVFATGQGPSSSNFDVNTMTVGGVSATKVADVTNSTDAEYVSELWRADVPSGTTGDIVVVWNSAMSQCGVIAWAVTGDHNLFDIQTNLSDSTASFTLTDIPDGSVILAGRGGTGSRTHTWSSDVTENVDEVIGSGVAQSGASSAKSTGGNFTVTCTPSSSEGRPRTVCIVLSPTQGAGTNGFYLPFTTSAGLGQDDSGSSSETKVQENTYNGGSEVNNGDMSGNPACIAYTAIATAKLATVKLNSSSRGFTNVTVQVQTDNGSNAPDGTTLTNGQVTGITGSGSGLKTVDFPNGGPELTAGTKYWICIPSTDLGSGFEWGIQHDVPGTSGAVGIIDSTGYQAGRGFGHEAYQLGNIWTPVNSPTQTSDSPTNNHCVWSEIFPKRSGNWTLSEGNRKATYSSSTDCGCPGSIGVSGAGTWYFEITASSSYTLAGIVSSTAIATGDLASSTPGNGFSDLGGVAYGYYANNGYKLGGPSNVHASYGATFANTDVIGVAFDAANGTLTFYKNGSTQGQAFTGISTSETWFPFVHTFTNEPGVLLNNGQTAFAHTPPTGYVGINTANLLLASAPTIEDGSAHHQTSLWEGDITARKITQSGFNSKFQPDWIWGKNRDNSGYSYRYFDSVRGATKVLQTGGSSYTDPEATDSNGVTDFEADGFDISRLLTNGNPFSEDK